MFPVRKTSRQVINRENKYKSLVYQYPIAIGKKLSTQLLCLLFIMFFFILFPLTLN